jgi:ATP-dependent Clp protease adapter protein ClpS
MSDGMWCVLVFNDNATPMEFVAYVLRQVFQQDADEARRITLGTHYDGITICAVYNRREDVVAKVAEASSLARQHGISSSVAIRLRRCGPRAYGFARENDHSQMAKGHGQAGLEGLLARSIGSLVVDSSAKFASLRNAERLIGSIRRECLDHYRGVRRTPSAPCAAVLHGLP